MSIRKNMKIDFLTPNYYPKINHSNYTSKPENQRYNIISDISNIYYIPFTGDDITLTQKLESLKGVHCPCCGVKMLSQQEFDDILKQAENIHSKEDFLKILNDNIESVTSNLRSNVNVLNKIASNKPEIDMKGLIAMSKTGANRNLENVTKTQIDFLKNFTNNKISDSDRQILHECGNKLEEMMITRSKGELVTKHKEILQEGISRMEYPYKSDIYTKLRNDFRKAYEKRSVMANLDADGKTQEYNVIKNIFSHSVSKANKFINNIEGEGNCKKILLCGKCSMNRTKAFEKMTTNPKETELIRYNRFLEDIASKIISEDTDIRPIYLVSLNGKMKRLSKGQLFIKGAPSMSELKSRHFLDRTEGVTFDLTEVEGIPCACCGKETITHKKRLELFDEINNTTTKQELVQILQDNKNVIRERYMPIVNDFINFVDENPDISDKELIEKLKLSSTKRIKSRLKDNNKYVYKILDKTLMSIQDRKLAQKYIKEVNENFLTLPDGKNFQWYDYNILLNSTINNMSIKNKKYILNHLKYNIKDIFTTEYALYPINPLLEKFDSPIIVIVQNILKESTATKDHVLAKHKSGSDDEKNIIVMCKNCNTYKSSSGFYNWLKSDKNIPQNITKYFNVINEKIKNGEIGPEYKNYLKELQIHLYEISKGQFDVDYSHDL